MNKNLYNFSKPKNHKSNYLDNREIHQKDKKFNFTQKKDQLRN